MDYRPQKITLALLRRMARARKPESPREIRDSARGIVLRHQPSGYMALYAQLGRGKRERLCNASEILDEYNPLTMSAVLERAKVLHGQSASGRDFARERRAERAIPTLTEYLNETYGPWITRNRRSGQKTLDRLRSKFKGRFGNRKLTDITPARMEKWRGGRLDNVKPETVNRDIADLHAALARAVTKWKIITENPLDGFEPSEVDRHKQVVRALTAAEKQKLIEALEARDDRKRQGRVRHNEWRIARGREPLPPIGLYSDVLSPAVILSMETGLRRGELFALEWGRVDFKAKTLRVAGSTAKTYETRDVPLNKTALETFRAWWMQRGQPKDGLVFTIDGEPVQDLKNSYHAVLKAAAIPRLNAKGERVDWHSLRHAFGSLLGAAGVDATTLMKLMGHANLRTTQRYLHTDQERKAAAVELLAS